MLLAPLALSLALATAGPTMATRPAVTGTLQDGKRLTATAGTWVGSGTIAYTYQWHRCDAAGAHCSSIHGATKSTYTQVTKDAGRTLGLTVKATDSTGSTFGYAPLVGTIGLKSATILATAQPPVSGEPIVGQPMKVEATTWTPATPKTLSYSWKRCNANGRICAPIDSSGSDTYTLTAADIGHVLVASVSANGTTVLSLGTGLGRAAPGPVLSSAPTIAGTSQQGKQLTGTAGTWSGSGTLAYAYQWYRCDNLVSHCSSIHGATKATYMQVAADVGKTIALTVKATDSTGTTAAYASAVGLVATAAATPVATGQATLTGAATAGQTLQVMQGTWTPAAPTTFTYTWLHCNANGRICTAIAGASAASYTLTADDTGHKVIATAGASLTVASPVVAAAA
jgi:hypothetical protein